MHTGGVVSWYRSVHTGQLCPGVKLWNTSELSDGGIVLRSSIRCGYHSGLALGFSNRMQCMCYNRKIVDFSLNSLFSTAYLVTYKAE